jgi:hypothetical protein
MKTLKTALGSFAAAGIATLALAPVAPAESLVPPGNSAAAQYTEAYPTAGGPRETGKGGGKRASSHVLGARDTRRLAAQGAVGRSTAEAAAATAPSAAVAAPGGEAAGRPGAETPAGPGHAAGGAESRPSAASPAGSSGLGEVVGQATGSSSGELGPLLPLLIAATAIWALAFLRRRTRKTAQ